MEWRAARASDLDSVSAWVATAQQCRLWAGRQVEFPIEAWQLAETIEFEADNAWCMSLDGELIGFGQLLQRSEQRAHLARLIISPDLRGLGYGTLLGEKLLETAAEALACKVVTLNVYRANLAAQALYARLGFRPIALPQSGERDPEVLLMARAL
jgi:[ribosomal protein S18]-alanine N-acetyltransferase